MIFLSHNHSDKPVVEPVAIRLREIFGENQVFYDSWSIQPGDGIIEKMNEGLASPKFVFFFVSAKSLASNMVKLEWQNALFKSTKGECKVIPVRVDGSTLPAVLLQNVYIDMFAQGIEAAIVQIVNVGQGNKTFTPQHLGFSNLTYKTAKDAAGTITITISASHLMEPNPDFLLFLTNNEDELEFQLNGGQPYRWGFNKDIKATNGIVANAMAIAPMGGAITPQRALTIQLSQKKDVPITLIDVLHQKADGQWAAIPRLA